jgi:hypothetical protein
MGTRKKKKGGKKYVASQLLDKENTTLSVDGTDKEESPH